MIKVSSMTFATYQVQVGKEKICARKVVVVQGGTVTKVQVIVI